MSRLMIFLSALIVVACVRQNVSRAAVNTQYAKPTLATTCELNRNWEVFLGRTVLIEGLYKTDSYHYEYVLDEQCGRSLNAVEIGRHGQSESYKKFQQKWSAICEKRGDSGLCVFEANVQVLGTIRHAADGWVIDVVSIREQK